MRNTIKKDGRSLRFHITTNLILGALILSVGALCFAPTQTAATTQKEQLYRFGNENSGGVSLMFNVYWGNKELDDILEILDKYDAKATFFIGGCWADDNVETLREIYTQGHEIGNHGYFHKDHSKMSLEENKKEISSCNRFIELAIGYTPTLFAPPSGAYNEKTFSACSELKMDTILWSKDTIDWRDKNPSLIYTRATKNVRAGDLILMHPMQATVDALEDIIKYYHSQSLSLITVTENIKTQGKG
jgi:peptidoglycan/xylan/chitin deacetylase (PgdA/CDA1 family)